MANMSYCRFTNTVQDANDCLRALENRRNINSQNERKKAMELLENILEFCECEGIISEYDSERIAEIINECKEDE